MDKQNGTTKVSSELLKQIRTIKMSSELYKEMTEWCLASKNEQAAVLLGKNKDGDIYSNKFCAREHFAESSTPTSVKFNRKTIADYLSENTKPNNDDVAILMHTHPGLMAKCGFSHGDSFAYKSLHATPDDMFLEFPSEPGFVEEYNDSLEWHSAVSLLGVEVLHGVATAANIDITKDCTMEEIVQGKSVFLIEVDGKVKYSPLFQIFELFQNIVSTAKHKAKKITTNLRGHIGNKEDK